MISVQKDIENLPVSLTKNSPRIANDVRLALEKQYNRKCCYCEDSLVDGEVEHYRCRSKYSWLEFEWENLMWSCHKCNQNKGAKFDINGKRATPPDSFAVCDAKEKPLMINPEKDNIEQLIEFERNGNIKSTNHRMRYTIETCKLNRKNLNDKRKTILDQFQSHIETCFILGCSDNIAEYIVKIFTEPLKNNKEQSFIAFRHYIVNHWLGSILNQYS